MDQKDTGVFKNALTWGIIYGLLSIIFSVVLYVLDQGLNKTLSWLSILITIGVLVFGTKNYRDSVCGGVLPFGKAFTFSVFVVLIGTFISVIYTYLQFAVIDPGLKEKMLEMAMENMLEQGVPEDSIDDAMELSAKFMTPAFMTISGFFIGSIIGIIVGLITSAVLKKDEPEIPVEE